MLTTRVIESAEWGQMLHGAWVELEKASATASPFQTFGWVSSWWEAFGGRRPPWIVTVSEGRDLVGLYPLYRTGATGRMIRAMGSGQSDYLHPLTRAGYESVVAAELAAHLASAQDVDLVDLQQIREDQPLTGAFEAREQDTCWAIDLPESWDAFLTTLSKSLRADVRRIVRLGSRLAVRRPDPETALPTLLDLHRRRWRSRGLPGVFVSRRVRHFHRRLLSRIGSTSEEAGASIRILDLDGQPIGAIYLLRHGRTTCYYQSGFDPAAKRWSPGTVLIADSVREAIEDGHDRFDFLRGAESYKQRWRASSVRNVRILHSVRGGLGRVSHRFHVIGHSTERIVRTGWARLGWGS